MGRISWWSGLTGAALFMGVAQGCPLEEIKPSTGNTDGSNEADAGGAEKDACAGVRCKTDRHCKVTEVQCVRAPCPPLVECVLNDEGGAPGCELIDCRPGDKCVEDASGAGSCVADGGGEGVACGKGTCAAGDVCCNESCGVCTPPGGACTQQVCIDPGPTCDLDCKEGTHCELQEITCITTPCDPIPQCVADTIYGCELIDCQPGHMCIEDAAGNGECIVDACAAVRCKEGTHCETREVHCLGVPCDPIAECVADQECTGPIIDCAAPPEDCNYEGGGCVDGNWTCGKLVCVEDPCAALDCASCKVVDGKAQCGTPCGDNTCFNGKECCNASCGWCVDPGMACIQIACEK